ncbi:MAG: mannose-1-phosphate guanylyltransferase, partial [Planctomycetota bacterium]
AEHILVITNETQRAGTAERAPTLPPENIIAEPVGRNTAPCVGLAAVLAQVGAGEGEDPVVGVFPADAYIHPTSEFTRAVEAAVGLARDRGGIVTLGIPPGFAATGYGYVQEGESLPDCEPPAFTVRRFTEKPDRETADRFLREGGYLWNAGIFFFRASTVLEELRRQQPEIHRRLEAFRPAAGTDSQADALREAYAEMPAISFDYAVMEHAESVYVLRAPFDWDDLGSWASVARHDEPDSDGNVIRGDAVTIDSEGCVVDADRTVALVGVKDLIVVATDDAVLVCPRDRAQDVKEVVNRLREQHRDDLL